MRIFPRPKHLLICLCGLALLAACAPASAAETGVPAETVVSVETGVSAAAQSFDDPFAYCAGVGTVDQPDARYSGPKTPDAVVKGLMQATGAPADAPLEMFSRGTVWRCMEQQVFACFVGANLPCESKANPSQKPTADMEDFCKANTDAAFIPAAVSGRETIYTWGCKDGKAFAGKQVFQVDARGYIREIWYAIAP